LVAKGFGGGRGGVVAEISPVIGYAFTPDRA